MRLYDFPFPSIHRVRMLISAAAILVVFLGILQAQIKSGTIIGLVTDKTGAVIAYAEITVLNEETQVVDKSKSGGAGEYAVPYLAAGGIRGRVRKQARLPFRWLGSGPGP